MGRCLIVANQTLATDALSDAVQDRIRTEPHEFYVVAPATPAQQLVEGADAPSPTDFARAVAQQRLDRAVEQLRTLGAPVDGEVGDPDPVQAVVDALGRFEAEEILVSTLPSGLSHWLRRDVPARLRKACAVPVTHLEATAES